MATATTWLLIVAGALWLPFEGWVVWRNRNIAVSEAGGRASDILLVMALLGSAVAAAAVAIWGPTWSIGVGPTPYVIGLILVVAGVALRVWAVRTLGRFFSVQLTLQPRQPLITDGPYRYVRHPSYAGIVLIAAGVGIALNNAGILVVIVVPLTAAYVFRIGAEERFLRRVFGRAYDEYSRTTWRLIPGVW